MTGHVYSRDVTEATCRFIRDELVGRRIVNARVIDTRSPVQQINITFADGAVVSLISEHDESFRMEFDRA